MTAASKPPVAPAAKPLTLDDLRRYAVARTLFKPTTLLRAIEKLGFVQADPIRAPARAQDLTLRHRVAGYRAGDLERRYARLAVEEDFLVNYGFLPRHRMALLHPRAPRRRWDAETERKAAEVLAFVRERGAVHPRDVEARFAHGRVTNWFGGSSNAATQLLDAMHHRSLLRVVRRDGGTRVYAAAEHPPTDPAPEAAAARAAALLELVVHTYAPLPAPSLGYLASLLGAGAPHLRIDRRSVLGPVRDKLARARIDGTDWYWPADENPRSRLWRPDDRVRVLAPFDPIVWDRRRFTLLWGWTYRFEAYTPAPKRKLGYYALPVLWKDDVVGWANASVSSGRLRLTTHFPKVPLRDPEWKADFKAALADERLRLADFLGCAPR